ncbi:MAG: hypothetical protein WCG26_00955 [Chloroflexales bacterium]
MTTYTIHGTDHRIIPAEAIAWAREKLVPKLDDPWRGRFLDALKHLDANPVKCERQPNGTYRAAFRSHRHAEVEWYATEQDCTCTAGRTGKTCWHRAACIVLRQVDRWEKNELRKQFKVVYVAGVWGLKFNDTPVQGVSFDSFDDAVQGVKLSIEAVFTS